MGTRCADHVTPLYPQKLALTSPTGGGRSVGIVRVRTKATELFNVCSYSTCRRRFITASLRLNIYYKFIVVSICEIRRAKRNNREDYPVFECDAV